MSIVFCHSCDQHWDTDFHEACPRGCEAETRVMDLAAAIKHLAELADGWDCGAKLEDTIVAAYQPALDAFSASKTGDGQKHDTRLIRAVVDARSARDRFRKDAAALRTALAALAG